MVNYQIVLYDSNGVDLGRVSYAAATTRYPYVNRGWTEFTPNGLQHYEYNIPALASQLNVSPDDIHTILLYFNGYSSWWSGHNMIVRFDNVRTHVPIISITPSNHSFGTRALGWTSSQQFSVTNVMNHDITIDSLSLAGVDTQEFEILNDNCTGATLAPQETRTFDVAFTAESLGSKSVTVNISIPGQSADPVPVPLTALVTLPCEGDLNGDGRTDMSDWLLFGQRWGATNCTSVPCACDLNADGRCDMRDWLLFGRSWSRTDCPVQ
jgi:hypothetical protein